jgi:hypothetical protein
MILFCRRVVPLFLLACALAACGIGGPPSISDITLAKKLDADQKPVDTTTTFGPQDQINLSIQALNMEKGARVKAVFMYGEEQLDDVEITLDDGGSRYVGFTLPAPESGWPGGDGYQIDLFLNDEPKGSATYTIDGPSPNPRVAAVTLTHKLDNEDRATDKVTTFAPEDDFYASVEVADLKKGQQVEGRWYQSTKLIDSASADIENFTRERFVSFSLKSREDFPPGDYRLEIMIDGKLAKSTRFTVAVPGPELLSSTMSRGITDEEGAPVDPTDTFTGDQPIYYVAQFNPLPKGTRLEAHWFEGDSEFSTYNYDETEGFDEPVYFHFSYTPDPDNPLAARDDYRIDVYHDGEKIDSQTFKVIAPGPFAAIQFAPEATVDTYTAVGPAAEFPYGTAIIYASFSFSGMEDGTPWSWVWTQAGEEPVVGESTWDHGAEGTTWVRLTNPDGVTPGDYTLELLVRDSVVQVGQMRVLGQDQGDYTTVPADHQRYESPKFGVSVAHAPDWTAQENENNVSIADPGNGGLIFVSVLEVGDQEPKVVADEFIKQFGEDIEEDNQSMPSVDLGGLTTEWRGFSLVQDGQNYRGNVGVAKQGTKAHIFLNIYEISEAGTAANRASWTVAASYTIN